MNEGLQARIPTVAKLRMVAFADRTRTVAVGIGEILAEIKDEGRQPTTWESDNLLEAILFLLAGNPFGAAAHLEIAVAVPKPSDDSFTVPRHDRQTVAELEQKLRSVRP